MIIRLYIGSIKRWLVKSSHLGETSWFPVNIYREREKSLKGHPVTLSHLWAFLAAAQGKRWERPFCKVDKASSPRIATPWASAILLGR